MKPKTESGRVGKWGSGNLPLVFLLLLTCSLSHLLTFPALAASGVRLKDKPTTNDVSVGSTSNYLVVEMTGEGTNSTQRISVWDFASNSLPALGITGGGGVSNGDKGDITVSGATWTIDTDVVTDAKLSSTGVKSGLTTVSNSVNAKLGTNTGTAFNLTARPVGINDTPLEIRGISGQDTFLFSIFDSSDTRLFAISEDGTLSSSSTNFINGLIEKVTPTSDDWLVAVDVATASLVKVHPNTGGSSSAITNTSDKAFRRYQGTLYDRSAPSTRKLMFYDSFDGPTTNAAGFLLRRPDFGENISIALRSPGDTGTNGFLMKEGELWLTNMTASHWYLSYSWHTDFVPNWNWFGMRFRWVSNSVPVAGAYTTPVMLNYTNENGASDNFLHHFVSADGSVVVQTNTANTIMSFPAYSAAVQPWTNIVTWEVFVIPPYMQVTVNEFTTNIYCGDCSFATNKVWVMELSGSVTNSYEARIMDSWGGYAGSEQTTILDPKVSSLYQWLNRGTNDFATASASSNNVKVVAGTGGITVTPSGSGGVMTYTVSDDDAGAGGGIATVKTNGVNVGNGLTSLTFSNGVDVAVAGHSNATATGNISFSILTNAITSLTEDQTPATNDFTWTSDTSTATKKKVALANLPVSAPVVTALALKQDTDTELTEWSGISTNKFLTTNHVAFLDGLSNKVRVVAGTGGITVTPSGSSGVMTYTVSDDDAGGGGDKVDEIGGLASNLTLRGYVDIPWTNTAINAIHLTNGLNQIFNLGAHTNLNFVPGGGDVASNALPVRVMFTQNSTGGYYPTNNGSTIFIRTNANATTVVSYWYEKGVTNFSPEIAFTQLNPTDGDVWMYDKTTCGWTNVASTGTGSVMRTRVGVYRTIYVDAAAMVSNATTAETITGATFATTEFSAPTNRISDTYQFADAVTNAVQFKIAMPLEWDGGTIKAKFFWSSTNTTAGSITNVWALDAFAVTHDDPISTNGWGTVQIVRSKGVVSNNLAVSAATPAITIGGSPAAGDLTWFRVRRLGGHTDDQLTNSIARLHGVQIQYSETATEQSPW